MANLPAPNVMHRKTRTLVLSLVAYVTDAFAIRRSSTLSASAPQDDCSPPNAAHELVRVRSTTTGASSRSTEHTGRAGYQRAVGPAPGAGQARRPAPAGGGQPSPARQAPAGTRRELLAAWVSPRGLPGRFGGSPSRPAGKQMPSLILLAKVLRLSASRGSDT